MMRTGTKSERQVFFPDEKITGERFKLEKKNLTTSPTLSPSLEWRGLGEEVIEREHEDSGLKLWQFIGKISAHRH